MHYVWICYCQSFLVTTSCIILASTFWIIVFEASGSSVPFSNHVYDLLASTFVGIYLSWFWEDFIVGFRQFAFLWHLWVKAMVIFLRMFPFFLIVLWIWFFQLSFGVKISTLMPSVTIFLNFLVILKHKRLSTSLVHTISFSLKPAIYLILSNPICVYWKKKETACIVSNQWRKEENEEK